MSFLFPPSSKRSKDDDSDSDDEAWRNLSASLNMDDSSKKEMVEIVDSPDEVEYSTTTTSRFTAENLAETALSALLESDDPPFSSSTTSTRVIKQPTNLDTKRCKHRLTKPIACPFTPAQFSERHFSRTKLPPCPIQLHMKMMCYNPNCSCRSIRDDFNSDDRRSTQDCYGRCDWCKVFVHTCVFKECETLLSLSTEHEHEISATSLAKVHNHLMVVHNFSDGNQGIVKAKNFIPQPTFGSKNLTHHKLIAVMKAMQAKSRTEEELRQLELLKTFLSRDDAHAIMLAAVKNQIKSSST